ncbi:GNAT family N-acetyltransferase [Clostridium niameyense]|uniref:GNAT family N-acetyltransferase n=1 Tax=Clostridium niameyense TaxID=1622073 RepID=A0A6M0RDS8_9CLOT|nr:GNAT family protein [Clostridium niameyense]NEZ47980.1 GNAT family N-acetyltransferase [Clostridium niameyense]
MTNKYNISIDLVKGTSNEYIIRDVLGINIGRIFILELSNIDKYCLFRMSFYKSNEEKEFYLKEIIRNFTEYLFYKKDMYKINIIIDKNIDSNFMSDLGFYLEGIISNSKIVSNVRDNEFLYGIDLNTFKKNSIHKDFILRGESVNLRILSPRNAKELLEYYIRNRERLQEVEPQREEKFYTLDKQREILVESYKQYINGDIIDFGIYNNNRFIGKIKVSNIIMGGLKSAVIGYSIDKDFESKGYMKESLKVVIKYVFNEIGLHRLEASTLTENIKSQNLLLSCGFEKLGINRKYIFINGDWQDYNTYYLVK